MNKKPTHNFHIPVMGLAYTIDSPIRVAQFGISSVVSIIDDEIIERMRDFYSKKFNFDFKEISIKSEDHRAERITAYLDMMDEIVTKKFKDFKHEISKNTEWIDRFKVYTPRANNIGTELNDDNLNSFIGEPKTICTESYLVLGAELKLDLTKARNLSKYLTTKFTRFQHSLAKASQDATSKTYQFVPLQDFTSTSDIDWSQSVADIDRQLYAKYGLSEEEVAFIEGMIKGM